MSIDTHTRVPAQRVELSQAKGVPFDDNGNRVTDKKIQGNQGDTLYHIDTNEDNLVDQRITINDDSVVYESWGYNEVDNSYRKEVVTKDARSIVEDADGDTKPDSTQVRESKTNLAAEKSKIKKDHGNLPTPKISFNPFGGVIGFFKSLLGF